MRTRQARSKLVKDFEKRFSKYGPWVFEYIYDGYFCYHHKKDRGLDIFFTPGFEGPDSVAIQVQRDGEGTGDGSDVPFTIPTAENLFIAVKPWLDKYKG